MGEYTVKSVKIYCPNNADCVVTALSGHSNLFDTKFYAANSNLLNITSIQTQQNLMGAEIRCPAVETWGSQHNCNIKVSGGGLILTAAKIYAIESFTDVSLECDYGTDASECGTPVMWCGLSYEYSCDMTLISGYDEWGCADTTKTCHDHTFPRNEIICNTTHTCDSSYSCDTDQ
eukprot:190186_1